MARLTTDNLCKHQSEIANHRPGKPDTLSRCASVKPDMLSQHAKHRQAIPKCIAKVIVYKGLKSPEQWKSCGSQKNPIWRISRVNTATLQEAGQGIRHEA